MKRAAPKAETSAERRARWSEQHDRVQAAVRERAEATRGDVPIQKAWFSRCVEEAREDGESILVNELGVDPSQMCFVEPGGLYGHPPSGGLGWAMGAALGAKLAAPEKTVFCVVGDGSYIFGSPAATHWVSRAYDLPVVWIVYNNAGWNAVANATRGIHPEGTAVRTHNFPFTDLAPQLDFELFCQAAGGYGERVEDPRNLPNALGRALHAVKTEKRQALLNVIGQRPR